MSFDQFFFFLFSIFVVIYCINTCVYRANMNIIVTLYNYLCPILNSLQIAHINERKNFRKPMIICHFELLIMTKCRSGRSQVVRCTYHNRSITVACRSVYIYIYVYVSHRSSKRRYRIYRDNIAYWLR